MIHENLSKSAQSVQNAGEKIEKADADFARKMTGFAIGGIPPVGHIQKIETFIDKDLMVLYESFEISSDYGKPCDFDFIFWGMYG